MESAELRMSAANRTVQSSRKETALYVSNFVILSNQSLFEKQICSSKQHRAARILQREGTLLAVWVPCVPFRPIRDIRRGVHRISDESPVPLL